MVRASFDIISPDIQASDLRSSTVVMEVAEREFCYVLYNKEQRQFRALRRYTFDISPEKNTAEVLQEIVQSDDLLQQEVKETAVVYHYSDCSLLPDKFFHIDINKAITELIHGNVHKGLLLSEKILGWEMYNVYRIPREIHALFQKQFAAGKYWHYYTLLMSSIKKENGLHGYRMHIVFYTDKFVVAVFQDTQLQLLQTYEYQTPDDVSYYLLSICRSFGIDPVEVVLQISGLLDHQSALYTELMKYFRQLYWDELPGQFRDHQLLSEYPSHYFSPMLKLALCV